MSAENPTENEVPTKDLTEDVMRCMKNYLEEAFDTSLSTTSLYNRGEFLIEQKEESENSNVPLTHGAIEYVEQNLETELGFEINTDGAIVIKVLEFDPYYVTD